jgi:hypothetical protein
VFNDIKVGTLPGKVHLEVDDTCQPKILPPRRVPVALKDKFDKLISDLTDKDVLAPVDEPTAWVSQYVVATKKSGDLRICIDPGPLNEALKREHYSIPVIDDILPELSKARVFSKFDLRSGYWHCELDKESNLLTTFQTPKVVTDGNIFHLVCLCQARYFRKGCPRPLRDCLVYSAFMTTSSCVVAEIVMKLRSLIMM